MKIGIFGGAFNPVHNGHVTIAILSMEYLDLEKLLIVPTYDPPHRDPSILAPFELRLNWLGKVFDGIKGIEVSDFEEKMGGKSYSFYTIEHFSELYGAKPYFIIGEDSAVNFEKWYRYEDLMEMATFAVYPRFRNSRFEELKWRFPSFVLMDLPLIEISSTEIRRRIREGRSIRGMVDSSIEEEVMEFFGRENG